MAHCRAVQTQSTARLGPPEAVLWRAQRITYTVRRAVARQSLSRCFLLQIHLRLLSLPFHAAPAAAQTDFLPTMTAITLAAVNSSTCSIECGNLPCMGLTLGWQAGTIHYDASSGGPQPGYKLAVGGGRSDWSFQPVSSQDGIYRIGVTVGDGSGPDGSGNWCLSVQQCGSTPALYECYAPYLLLHNNKERWRVVQEPGTTVYMLQNYGCPETLLGVFNQTNRGDVSTCHISGIPDHPAAAAPPIDVWTIANFDGATQPKTASAVSVQFVLRSFVAAGLPTAWALLW